MPRVLTTSEEIQGELVRLIQDHKHLHWAVAWASTGFRAAKVLLKHKQKIERMVVGTHFHQTDPEFMTSLLVRSGPPVLAKTGPPNRSRTRAWGARLARAKGFRANGPATDPTEAVGLTWRASPFLAGICFQEQLSVVALVLSDPDEWPSSREQTPGISRER